MQTDPSSSEPPATEQDAGDPAEVVRVRVVGGPLNGNRYAVNFEPGGTVTLKSLGGRFVYQFPAISEGEPLLHYVGPAAPLA